MDGTKVVHGMIGRSAEDEGEYVSRAEEIEAWLKTYGKQFLGSQKEDTDEYNNSNDGGFHLSHWKYVILDDRPSAAKEGTPLFDRFVLTRTKEGLTEEDAEKVIDLLLHGPKAANTNFCNEQFNCSVECIE